MGVRLREACRSQRYACPCAGLMYPLLIASTSARTRGPEQSALLSSMEVLVLGGTAWLGWGVGWVGSRPGTRADLPMSLPAVSMRPGRLRVPTRPRRSSHRPTATMSTPSCTGRPRSHASRRLLQRSTPETSPPGCLTPPRRASPHVERGGTDRVIRPADVRSSRAPGTCRQSKGARGRWRTFTLSGDNGTQERGITT